MKFGEIKSDAPWFTEDETGALVAEIVAMRKTAHETVIARVRANDVHAAAEYVGQYDAFGRVLALIQEGK